MVISLLRGYVLGYLAPLKVDSPIADDIRLRELS